MCNEKGLILTITVIFILILVIMAGVALILMTNQARITEGQIKRIKAFYTAQAAITRSFDNLRTGGSVSDLTLNGLTAVVNLSTPINAPGSPINGTRQLTATVAY